MTMGNYVSSGGSVGRWMGLYFLQFGLTGWMWWRGGERGRRFVLLSGLVFRLLLLPAGLREDAHWWEMADGTAWERFLVYDHDVWRFLWDGHVSASGVNPYRYAPTEVELDGLGEEEPWRTVRGYVYYADLRSVYPPGAQGLFWVCNQVLPGSPLGPKLFSVAADLAIVAMLPGRWALLYAWNPLALKAGAASGHVDAVVGLLVLLAARARTQFKTAGVWWGLSLLTKLSPIVLLPWMWRHVGLKGVGVGLVVAGAGNLILASHLGVYYEGVAEFARQWEFNAPLHLLGGLMLGSRDTVRLLMAALTAAIIARVYWRRDLSAEAQAAWALVAVVLLSPAVMPWYLLWALPVGLAGKQLGPFAFTGPMGLAMLVMVEGTENMAGLALELVALGALFAVTFPWRRTGAGEKSTDPP
jgi:alpha-1,6-mannosyltransferase